MRFSGACRWWWRTRLDCVKRSPSWPSTVNSRALPFTRGRVITCWSRLSTVSSTMLPFTGQWISMLIASFFDLSSHIIVQVVIIKKDKSKSDDFWWMDNAGSSYSIRKRNRMTEKEMNCWNYLLPYIGMGSDNSERVGLTVLHTSRSARYGPGINTYTTSPSQGREGPSCGTPTSFG